MRYDETLLTAYVAGRLGRPVADAGEALRLAREHDLQIHRFKTTDLPRVRLCLGLL